MDSGSKEAAVGVPIPSRARVGHAYGYQWGPDFFAWWREQGLPLRQIISRNGRLAPVTYGTPGWESNNPEAANQFYAQLVGKTVRQAKKIALDLLRPLIKAGLVRRIGTKKTGRYVLK